MGLQSPGCIILSVLPFWVHLSSSFHCFEWHSSAYMIGKGYSPVLKGVK